MDDAPLSPFQTLTAVGENDAKELRGNRRR